MDNQEMKGVKSKGKRGAKPKTMTEERIRIIVDARRRGETYERCCALAGIGHTLLFREKAKGGEFAERVKKAEKEFQDTYRDELLAKAKRSLTELVTGYEYNENKTEYKADRNGNPQIQRQTTVKKHMPPSPTAIIFSLTNLDPENWKNRQYTNVDGRIDSDSNTKVSLANVPDDLLAKVIDAIRGDDK